MKSTTLPPLRVPPELRRRVEEALGEGETLSSFMLEAIALNIERRQIQQEFIARGLASDRAAEASGRYVSATKVLGTLRRRLEKARAQKR